MSELNPFDSQWFKTQLRAVGSRQIDLAAALGCTSGNACRLLSGQYAIRLKDVAVLASVLRVSEPVRWKEGQAHFIALRRRDGRMDTPVEIEPPPGGDPFQVHVLDPLPFEPDLGGDRERTFYALGPGDTWAQRVLVRSLRPRSRQVEISGVCEDDRVHVN